MATWTEENHSGLADYNLLIEAAYLLMIDGTYSLLIEEATDWTSNSKQSGATFTNTTKN